MHCERIAELGRASRCIIERDGKLSFERKPLKFYASSHGVA